MNSDVRIAMPDDEEPLMALLREMHVENGMAPLDEDKVRLMLQRGIRQDMALIGVIRGPKEIEASIGLFVGAWWYSDSLHIEDLWNFVHPRHRTTPTGRDSHAKKLLRFAKEGAAVMARPMLIGVLSTTRTQAKVRLYEREFGTPAGALFVVNGAVGSPKLDAAANPS